MGNRKITLKTIKNRDAIHPYSRKAKQLTRVYQRKEKIADQQKKKQNNPIGDRWIWFRYAFDEEKPVATKDELHELIEQYLERHDEEIEQLENERNGRHKRPKSARQVTLESLIESEKSEYISGLELPDMTNGKVLKLLREWDGDKNSMTRIATIRIHKKQESDSKGEKETVSNMNVDSKKQKNPSTNNSSDMMEL